MNHSTEEGAQSHETALHQAEATIMLQLEQMHKTNDEQALIAGLEILHKLIQKMQIMFHVCDEWFIKNPHDEKYRTIKKTNTAIQKKLMSIKGIQALIQSLGYLDIDEEHYVFVGDYFLILLSGSSKIEDKIQAMRVKYLSPEERKKWEILEQQKQEFKEQQLKKQEYMRLMQRQQEEDRKFKAEQKAKSSVANQLNFGANIKKFEPPVNKGG